MKIILIILLSLVSLSSFAYKINAKLEITKGSSEWVEGETREVLLTVWPVEEIDHKYLKENFEGNDFIDNFFVSKVVSNNFSKNNPTAYEVRMNLTLKNFFNRNKPQLWNYKALVIPVTLHQMIIKKDPKKINEYKVLNVNRIEISKDNIYYYIGAVFCSLLLIILLIIGSRLLKKKKIRLEEKKVRDNWVNLIQMAESRTDIEYLYEKRDVWMNVLGGKNPQFIQLLDVINKHQYKKDWKDEDLTEINFILSEIKESV